MAKRLLFFVYPVLLIAACTISETPSAQTSAPSAARCNAATFFYQVTLGNRFVSRTKSITRQVFRPPGTVCR